MMAGTFREDLLPIGSYTAIPSSLRERRECSFPRRSFYGEKMSGIEYTSQASAR